MLNKKNACFKKNMRFSLAFFYNPVRIYLCEWEKERYFKAYKKYLKIVVDLTIY